VATISIVAKMRKPLKFATRFRNRCRNCGRGRAFYRDFGLCRLCFRQMAHKGLIPGIVKSSW
jgi:small subunit ribosomal protein S14